MNFRKLFGNQPYQKQIERNRYRVTRMIVALVLSMYKLITGFFQLSEENLVLLKFCFLISLFYAICSILVYFQETSSLGMQSFEFSIRNVMLGGALFGANQVNL